MYIFSHQNRKENLSKYIVENVFVVNAFLYSIKSEVRVGFDFFEYLK